MMIIRSAVARRLFSNPSSCPSSYSWCTTTSTRSSLSSSLVDQKRSSSSSSSAVGVGLPAYMRAAVFWEPNKPLTIEEFHIPRPKSGEILIKTKACGVCHSDLHVLKGELPFASPCVVGHEITGEIVEHGPATDKKTTERLIIRQLGDVEKTFDPEIV